jgi:NAD(P)-dependent dehydrogenase (short-subunit alcohol dehydrogenase family)
MTHDTLAGRRILVAEDDPGRGRDLAEALAAAGAVVVGPARRIEEALALLQSAEVDGAVVAIDLDGVASANVIIALRLLSVPVVLAMDDVSAHDDFWRGQVPRVAKPVAVGALAAALERAAGLIDPRSYSLPPALYGRDTALDVLIDWAAASRAINDAALVEMDRGQPTPDAALPVVEIDAGAWRNDLDLYAALAASLGVPDHQTNLDGWLEIIFDGAGFNALEPPFTIRIVNAAGLKPGLRSAIALLATTVHVARKEWGHNPNVEVTIAS